MLNKFVAKALLCGAQMVGGVSWETALFCFAPLLAYNSVVRWPRCYAGGPGKRPRFYYAFYTTIPRARGPGVDFWVFALDVSATLVAFSSPVLMSQPTVNPSAARYAAALCS